MVSWRPARTKRAPRSELLSRRGRPWRSWAGEDAASAELTHTPARREKPGTAYPPPRVGRAVGILELLDERVRFPDLARRWEPVLHAIGIELLLDPIRPYAGKIDLHIAEHAGVGNILRVFAGEKAPEALRPDVRDDAAARVEPLGLEVELRPGAAPRPLDEDVNSRPLFAFYARCALRPVVVDREVLGSAGAPPALTRRFIWPTSRPVIAVSSFVARSDEHERSAANPVARTR